MLPEVETMLSKSLTAETMNTDAALKLLSEVFRFLRYDYVLGKSTLLSCYGRALTEKEFNDLPHKTEGRNTRLIRLYFDAKRTVERDYYGVGDSVLPEDIFASWDVEVQKHTAGKKGVIHGNQGKPYHRSICDQTPQ